MPLPGVPHEQRALLLGKRSTTISRRTFASRNIGASRPCFRASGDRERGRGDAADATTAEAPSHHAASHDHQSPEIALLLVQKILSRCATSADMLTMCDAIITLIHTPHATPRDARFASWNSVAPRCHDDRPALSLSMLDYTPGARATS